MIRIVAGEYGSRYLKTLEGNSTRPTSEKVRGAIFSSIGTYFDDGVVLDLFSGSGAMAFEALSRGFSEAYLIDNNIKAIKVLNENKNIFNNKSINIMKLDYKKALLELKDKKFDLIYVDPPYKLDVYNEVIDFIYEYKMLKENAYLICESLKDYEFEKRDLIYKSSTYGISKISYFRG